MAVGTMGVLSQHSLTSAISKCVFTDLIPVNCILANSKRNSKRNAFIYASLDCS